jgi:hypothetical protein
VSNSKILSAIVGQAREEMRANFFVAGELCRRGYSAVVTLGKGPNASARVVASFQPPPAFAFGHVTAKPRSLPLG